MLQETPNIAQRKSTQKNTSQILLLKDAKNK